MIRFTAAAAVAALVGHSYNAALIVSMGRILGHKLFHLAVVSVVVTCIVIRRTKHRRGLWVWVAALTATAAVATLTWQSPPPGLLYKALSFLGFIRASSGLRIW